MRSAGNFSSEWGYLAPAPSFMRTARVVLVATAVGATAGAGVVLSLADRPAAGSDRTSMAAHAIVTGVQAATASTMPLTSAASATVAVPNSVTANALPLAQTPTQIPAQVAPQMQAESQVQPRPAVATQSAPIAPTQPALAGVSAENFGASETNTASAPHSASGIAALSTDAAPADVPDVTTVVPEAPPPQKKTKHSTTGPNAANGKTKPAPGLGSVLQRLFTAHAGTSYYPSRGL